MVTIADVARRAGVSIATVSRVLSPGAAPHPVSAATAARVRAAADALRFVPSEVARGLVARRSGLLGLVVPDLTDPHYPQIARGVEDAARATDLSVLICNTLGSSERLADYLQVLRARRVDAIVLSGGASLGAAELHAAAQCGVPVVLIGRPSSAVELPYVSIDNVFAARQATQHLIDGGRTWIVHLEGPPSQTTMLDRALGYLQAVEANGVDGQRVPTTLEADHAYAALLEFLATRTGRRKRPDAVFAATDRLAVAALAALHDAHLRVPEDVAVMGFDDMPLAALLRPALSSVAQPADALGTHAVEMAMRLASGRSAESVELAARLVLRASTQPLRTKH